jgi:hypothetical protein
VETLEHHLQTPRTVIVGRTEMLIDHGSRSPADAYHSLENVLRAGRRLCDAIVGICDLVDATCVDPSTVAPVYVPHCSPTRSEGSGIALPAEESGWCPAAPRE